MPYVNLGPTDSIEKPNPDATKKGVILDKLGAVPTSRTINGVDLSANRSLADLGVATAAQGALADSAVQPVGVAAEIGIILEDSLATIVPEGSVLFSTVCLGGSSVSAVGTSTHFNLGDREIASTTAANNGSISLQPSASVTSFAINSCDNLGVAVGGLLELNLSGCFLVSLDISRATSIDLVACNTNYLRSLDISANPAITGIDVSNNRLSAQSVNSILASLDAAGLSNGTCYLEGGANSAPTIGPPDGIAAAASLDGKGWDVVTN